MNIDILAATDRQAVVAKALETQVHGLELHDYVHMAKAVLLALDEHANAREFGAEPFPDFELSAAQEIRARALDSAARFAVGSDAGERDLLEIAVMFAGWVETGTQPDPADG
jgi:hypothetical protein